MIDFESLGESIAQAIIEATEPLKKEISELRKQIDSIPAGKDGKDGEKGEDGKDGAPGKDADIDAIKEIISQSVELKIASALLGVERRVSDVLMNAVSNIPAPKDGKDGADGPAGRDGLDGLGFDDMFVEYDGERSLSLVFSRGDQEKRFDFKMPVVIYKGIYKEAEDHQTGDAVTFGGSLWIAQKNSPSGKPGESDDWKLAVKKGRDGKNGADGKKGEKGDPGERGKDLTQMGFGGEKW